jgi:hypothetical protein
MRTDPYTIVGDVNGTSGTIESANPMAAVATVCL